METNNYLSKGYVQFLLTVILIGVAFALAAYIQLTLTQAQGVYTGDTTVTVTGEGEVFAKPDTGQFSFSVMAEADTAEAAQEASAESINTIMGYLEEAGIEEKDIKTTGYNVYPRYEWERSAGCTFPGGDCDQERVLKGYETTQTVYVKVRETDKAGELISGVGSRGATNISGLNFTIDDEAGLQAEAREKAIADAKEKAEELADDLGMRIVRVVGFNEGGNYPVMYAAKGLGGAEMAMDESVANVAPSLPMGENTIMSNVSISYELK